MVRLVYAVLGRRLLRFVPGGWLTLLVAPRAFALARAVWRRRQARRRVLAAR